MDTLFTSTFVFSLVFILIIVVFLRNFFRMGRFTDRVFRRVEKELDRQQAEPVRCDHCGSRVSSGEACPNCGAPLK